MVRKQQVSKEENEESVILKGKRRNCFEKKRVIRSIHVSNESSWMKIKN